MSSFGTFYTVLLPYGTTVNTCRKIKMSSVLHSECRK